MAPVLSVQRPQRDTHQILLPVHPAVPGHRRHDADRCAHRRQAGEGRHGAHQRAQAVAVAVLRWRGGGAHRRRVRGQLHPPGGGHPGHCRARHHAPVYLLRTRRLGANRTVLRPRRPLRQVRVHHARRDQHPRRHRLHPLHLLHRILLLRHWRQLGPVPVHPHRRFPGDLHRNLRRPVGLQPRRFRRHPKGQNRRCVKRRGEGDSFIFHPPTIDTTQARKAVVVVERTHPHTRTHERGASAGSSTDANAPRAYSTDNSGKQYYS
mmetsp:Transcript_10350/g.25442  ORF Transcript_10350/g.25442 Transcript_10350/m.25442 type:complete len:264 (+) Transcript_10350:1158-1949(+)